MGANALPPGQIDLLILTVMQRGPLHGYAIIEALRRRSGGVFDLPEGTVYPALYRLERMKLLSSRTQTVSGRRRRVYQLTEAGRAEREVRHKLWHQMAAAVSAVLGGKSSHARA